MSIKYEFLKKNIMVKEAHLNKSLGIIIIIIIIILVHYL